MFCKCMLFYSPIVLQVFTFETFPRTIQLLKNFSLSFLQLHQRSIVSDLILPRSIWMDFCFLGWGLRSYMSCKRCHPMPRTRGVSRWSVLKANAVSSIVIQLAKKAFVSQLLLPLLSIKPTICRFCMQDIHYLAFKGIPTSQKWIC